MAEVNFVSWDRRPAVFVFNGRGGADAWAVLERNGSWVKLPKVSADDVLGTAGLMSEEGFQARFPGLPPLPAEAGAVGKASSAGAAESTAP